MGKQHWPCEAERRLALPLLCQLPGSGRQGPGWCLSYSSPGRSHDVGHRVEEAGRESGMSLELGLEPESSQYLH